MACIFPRFPDTKSVGNYLGFLATSKLVIWSDVNGESSVHITAFIFPRFSGRLSLTIYVGFLAMFWFDICSNFD